MWYTYIYIYIDELGHYIYRWTRSLLFYMAWCLFGIIESHIETNDDFIANGTLIMILMEENAYKFSPV